MDLFLSNSIKPLDSNFSINKLWKIFIPKPKIIKKEEVVDINKTKPIEVTLEKKTLCIEKKCFRLLGIFLDKQYASSFYVKDAKTKVQTFHVGEKINSSIKITNIDKNSVVFKDINSSREWRIKMFDINSSKYKPKEF